MRNLKPEEIEKLIDAAQISSDLFALATYKKQSDSAATKYRRKEIKLTILLLDLQKLEIID